MKKIGQNETKINPPSSHLEVEGVLGQGINAVKQSLPKVNQHNLLNWPSSLDLHLKFDASVFAPRSKLQQFFKKNTLLSKVQQSTVEHISRELVTIKFIKALAYLNLLDSEASSKAIADFNLSLKSQVYTDLSSSRTSKNQDSKLLKQLNHAAEQASSSVSFESTRDAKSFIDAVIQQYYSNDKTLPDALKPNASRFLLESLIDSQMEKQLGGKFNGLKKLEVVVEGTGVKVPPFVGLNAFEIQHLIKTRRLPIALVRLMNTFGSDPDVRLMIRSSSNSEDQDGQANAGCFETKSNIKISTLDLIKAIKEVNDSFSSETAELQSALYNADGQTDEVKNTSHGIVAQQMIGEIPGQIETIPVSGVALSPDPLSHAENTFNINASHGHGEGIVQGAITTDETLGIIDPSSDAVHARTLAKKKVERFAPSAEGLKFTANTLDSQRQQALSTESIAVYAGLLKALKPQHKNGVDIEFVVQNKESVPEHFAVQQRSQDKPTVDVKPSYLSDQYVSQQKSIPVQLKSYSTFAVENLNTNQVIINPSLDKAFNQDFLHLPVDSASNQSQKSIKAVFVTSPANANAHAALMLRRQGIAIVEFESEEQLNELKSNSQFVLDQERKLVIPEQHVPLENIVQGRLSYPAPAAYSIADTKTELHEQDLKELELLKPIITHCTSSQVTTTQLLSELHQVLTSADATDSSKAHRLIAQLLHQQYNIMRQAELSDHDDFKIVAHEVAVDLVKLSRSVRLGQSQLHHLLYMNWIKAGLYQDSSSVPNASSLVSVKTAAQDMLHHEQFIDWMKAVRMNHDIHIGAGKQSRDPAALHPNTQSAIVVLHRLASALPEEQKINWLQAISKFIRDPKVQETAIISLASQSVTAHNAGIFTAFISDLQLSLGKSRLKINSISEVTQLLAVLEPLEKFSSRLSALEGKWKAHAGFEERLKTLVDLDVTLEPLLKFISGDKKPHMSSIILKQASEVFEKIDLALKEIVVSPEYDESVRKQDFKDLLKVFYKACKPVIEGTFSQAFSDMQQLGRYLDGYSILTQSAANNPLVPSPDFNVSTAMINASVMNSSVTAPKNYGDLHTILHQSTRNALGALAVKSGIDRLLPQHLQELQKWIKSGPLGVETVILQNVEVINPEHHKIYFNIPLREHGLRLALDVHKSKVKVYLALDGNNENNRFGITTSLLSEVKHDPLLNKTRIGRDQWINAETASPFSLSWDGDLDDLPLFKAKFEKLVTYVASTSYEYANNTFRDAPDDIKRENRLLRLKPQYDKIRELPHELQLDALTQFVKGYLQYNPSSELKHDQIPLHRYVATEDVKAIIQESGFLDQKLGLFEFDRYLQVEVLFNEPGRLSKKDILNFINDTVKFNDLMSDFTDFSSRKKISTLDKRAQVLGELMPELLSVSDIRVQQLMSVIRELLRSKGYADAGLLHYMMNLNNTHFTNVRELVENTPSASMGVLYKDLDGIANPEKLQENAELVSLLKKYVDVNSLQWRQPGLSGQLLAGSAPLSNMLSLSAFYEKMIDLNVKHIIDLRADEHYLKNPNDEYYPKANQSVRFYDYMKVTLDRSYQVGFKLGIDDPLPIKLQSDYVDNMKHALTLTAYRKWADFSVISVDDLKALGQIIITAAEKGENVFVHCAGGIGRTGTLTTYAQVKSIIDGNHDIEWDDLAKYQLVHQQILQNRQNRAAGSVETVEQFQLILQALGVESHFSPDKQLGLYAFD